MLRIARYKSAFIGFFAAVTVFTGVAVAASYGVFSPGGALSGTWNSQNVNLSAGGSFITGVTPFANGGTNLSVAADDTVLNSNGTAWSAAVVPNCTDTGGNHLNYTAASNAFSCGTSGGGAVATTGTFTATQTGCTAGSTGDLGYIKIADIVVLHATGGGSVNCTSNTTAMTFTGLPAAIRPSGGGSGSVTAKAIVFDNGALVDARATVDSSGVITFGIGAGYSATAFTASGTKGINNSWMIVYHTDATNP